MKIRLVIGTILVGILVGILGHRLYWMPLGLWLSIVFSTLAALLTVGLLKIIAWRANLTIQLGYQLIAAATGGLLVLFATSFVPSDSEYIYVDCTTSPVKVDKDRAAVDLWGEVVWLGQGTSKIDFTIQFKSQTPFKDNLGAYKTTIPTLPGTGRTNKEIARGYGRFYYSIICANGNRIDPMVEIPRPHALIKWIPWIPYP